ncbi:AfsR/SARP family transcriptional regulator [Streptomyces fuscichromogenes]|uniref:AfsR/SARP family transcriptional regulator n=1 Tax=Streptomyces fuscichromogenes TaxID=1324013 RepID=UPI003808A431
MSERIRFAVLGQIRAVRAEQSVRVGSPQQQAMLAVLLLRSGRSASMQELVDAVWGEEPPHSAAATIRTYAWRLRQTFTESRSQQRTLLSVGDGYRMALPPEAVDAVSAEQLAVQAVEHRNAGRLTVAGERIGQALALWRGEPLAGVPGPHAEQQRHRLDELRLTLLEEHFDVLIRQGMHLLAVPELGALVSAHPLRERFHALYMRALHAASRQADALAVYHRLRRHLADELGVDPSRELRELHQELLADEPAHPSDRGSRVEVTARTRTGGGGGPDRLSAISHTPAPARVSVSPPDTGTRRPGPAVAPAATLPPSPAPALVVPATAAAPAFEERRQPVLPRETGGTSVGAPPVPAQLPPDIADFTGRIAALDRLMDTLDPDRAEQPCLVGTARRYGVPPVAVITGMGGAGKTALAVRAAHQVRDGYPDGQLYADMRGAQHDPADPGVVLTGFITALGVAAQFVPDSIDNRAALLRSLLNGRRTLILLDNVRDPAQITPLLPGSATCAVLITSRSRLWGLPTSVRVDLPGFDTDEALELLERIIGPARPAEDPAAARELVRSCGLLPLAVRIAAARLASRPTWSAASLTARLTDERRRITELRAGDLTVAAVFEIGYQQLPETHARTFRLIAMVCDPEIGLPAAAAVLELSESSAEEHLESLVDASLLETTHPGRYRYHDLLRAFAHQHTTPAERLLALDRQLDFLLATAAGAFQRAVPGDAVAATLSATRSAGTRLDDVRAARVWAATESEGAFSAVLAAAREARSAPAAGQGAATLLPTAVDLLIALTAFGPYVQREQLVQAAVAVAEAAETQGDRRTVGRARFLCGNIAVQSTRLATAREHLRVAERHCRETGDAAILCQTLNDLGLIALFEHRYEEAVERLDEAAALAGELGQRSGELVTTVNAALARLRGGRAEEAVVACEAALEALRATADHQGVAYALSVLGQAMHELGRYEDAVVQYTECLGVCRAMELHGREAQAHYRLADTLRAMGRAVEAVAIAERAVARSSDGRSERDHGHALVALGRALAEAGRAEEAVPRLAEAVTVFTGLGLPDAADARKLLDGLAVR